ncbi:MAG: SRPBCC family protein [Methylomonas sp.]
MNEIMFAFLFLLIAVLFYASTKPDTFRVERTINIRAKPETIFPLIADLHEMQTWSAWEKVDPKLYKAFSGAPQGVGAIYEWQGNQQIGQGRMEIIEATPPTRIIIKMDFIKPFTAQNTVEFFLQSEAGSTWVSEVIFGAHSLLSKLMSLIFGTDKMIGGKLEKSLSALKAIAEK